MGSSILKISGLRSIFRNRRNARMIGNSPFIRLFSSNSQISSSSSSPPWLMLSPHSRNTCYKFYSFAEDKVLSIPKPDLKEDEDDESTKIFGSSNGWLACFNCNRSEVFLSNPLSGRRVNLPPIDNLPEIPEYNLKHGTGCISKILISCSDPESEECRAMLSFGWVDRFAFCRPGRSEWKIIGSEQTKFHEDFVYCATQDLFFSVRHNPEELEAWDLRDPLSPRLVWSSRIDEMEPKHRHTEWSGRGFGKRKYLVVSQQGELFLVYRHINPFVLPDGSRAPLEDDEINFLKKRYPSKTMDFRVHKIVREGKGGKMVEMDGHLDGMVMFIGGLSHGMAMPVSQENGFPPNSIFFTADAEGIHWSTYGTDNGVFDYQKKTFSSCYYPCDIQSLKKKILPPPLWFTPNQLTKLLYRKIINRFFNL